MSRGEGARKTPDAAVLGAGAAGLAAARALRQAGASVVVLEARDRLGGRVHTVIDPLLGVPLELGAEFVHGQPEVVRRLAQEEGLAMREVTGEHLCLRGRRLESCQREFARSQEILLLDPRPETSLHRLLARPEVRWRYSPRERELARGFVEGFFLADARRAGTAALAAMSRGSGGIEGGRTFRLEGGYAPLMAALARSLSRERGELRLATVVEQVRFRPGAVDVRARAASGARLPILRARRALVALPAAVLAAGKVRFSPRLREKEKALGRIETGPVVKIILRFRSRFWEEPGARRGLPLRNLGFFHGRALPVPVFWTLAPLGFPVWVGWAGGPAAARLSEKGEAGALAAALEALARALCVPRPRIEERLEGWRVADWQKDALAGGGYAVFPVGASDAPAILARPVAQTLFFAGEATDLADAGTVAGAMKSGERAARELLASLVGRGQGSRSRR
jgi:monoamine oxidase